MRYRLLAVDLDETLLDASSGISPRNKKAIGAAAGRGVIVIISTGRIYCSALPYVKELDLNEAWPVISYQGALISTMGTGEVLLHCPMTLPTAVAVAAAAEESNEEICAYIDGHCFINRENRYSRFYQKKDDLSVQIVGRLDRFLEQGGRRPTKMTIFNWEGEFTALKNSLRGSHPDEFTMLRPYPYFLEFTHRKATKGQALRWLAGKLDIRREEIISFGDSSNDLDMIQYAGLGVAVANAVPEVLEAADLVTAANIEDGVARLIEEYISSGLL